MNTFRIVKWMFSISVMVLAAGLVSAQNYPTKPIRIVTSPPGGGNDFAARLIAQGLQGRLGQPVIIDNRPGGVILVEAVTKAPPDGYTLMFWTNGIWVLPLFQKVPYDAVKDLLPITLVGETPNVLVVHPSLPVKSVKELIALAKAKPGVLNYGGTTPSSSGILSAELFKSMAGVSMVGIRYKGNGPAIIALLSGEVQLLFGSGASVAPHLKSGRLRGVAVTSALPSALTPGLPTVAASLPGFELGQIYGVYAPAKTPAAIVGQLSREIISVLNNIEMKRKMLDGGIEVVAGSPEQLAAAISSETIRMDKVIKDAGLRAE